MKYAKRKVDPEEKAAELLEAKRQDDARRRAGVGEELLAEKVKQHDEMVDRFFSDPPNDALRRAEPGSWDELQEALDADPDAQAEEVPDLTTTAREFAQLKAKRAGLKDELSELEAEIGALEEKLLRAFEGAECERITIAGRTLFPRMTRRASLKRDLVSPADYQEVLCFLQEAAGLPLTVNAQTLASWVRSEFQTAKDEGRDVDTLEELGVPAVVCRAVNVYEQFNVSMRKA